MKDIIIGCSTRYTWDQLKYWVNSINKCGFTGDKVLIVFECDLETVKILEKNNINVISVNDTYNYRSNIPVHVERFIHIYHYLSQYEYRYVITTDVKDVVFQNNPSTWLEKNIGDKGLVVGSESLKYKDEPWGDDNLKSTFGDYIYEEYKEKTIYNVGTLAGKYNFVKDLSMMLFTMSINRPIPIVDQATFNLMMNCEPWKSTTKYCNSEDGWAAQLGTTADPSKIKYFEPNLLEPKPILYKDHVTTSTGEKFVIVHQYDRVPDLKSNIEKKFR